MTIHAPHPSFWLSKAKALLRVFTQLALLSSAFGWHVAHANELELTQAPTSPLGEWTQWLVEQPEQALNLDQARLSLTDGKFTASQHSVPSFGLGGAPVWLHLQINNTDSTALARWLLLGTTWLDELDIYLLRDDQVLQHWRAGDGLAEQQRAIPGQGFVFSHDFQPGTTDLFIRASTPDPLNLPLKLLSEQQYNADLLWQHYSYGFLYGFLLALLTYNLMLYAGLRQRRYLDYSVYLGCFILLNMAYSGHGWAWLWTDQLSTQRYVIGVFMLLFGYSGLRFATHFLALEQQAPQLDRNVRLFCRLSLAALLLSIALQSQLAAVIISFSFFLIFTFSMIALGIFSIHRKHVAGRYYLLAVCCSAIGATCTALASWGIIPFNNLTHRAASLGVMSEAILLALALVYQMRQDQQARKQAENLARIDPLTGLLNRRSFLEQGEALWSSALRNQRPLTVIMLDLDFFKQINDSLGHAAGDQALVKTARLLSQACRRSDLAARWGGEEFILLLPEAGLAQAVAMAERLREQIGELRPDKASPNAALHASFGVAERTEQASLEALIADADHWLYAAKQGGRNQVMAPS